MLWDSIVDGAEILTYWRFWAVVAGAGLLGLVPLLLIGIAGAANETLGCLLAPIMYLWQPVVVTAAVVVLAPLMVVKVNYVAWEMITVLGPWSLAKIAVAGFVAAIIFGFLPLPSISVFAQTSVVLGAVTFIMTNGNAVVWPGFISGAILAVVGGVTATLLVYIALVPIGMLAAVIDEDVGALIAQPAGAALAIVPGCFYAGWLHQANWA